MDKEINELKLIIAENMATYSKAKMPYDEALRMSALGILASGYNKEKTCKFHEKTMSHWDGDVVWECDSCREEWVFPDGSPMENNLKYCPHCGAKVIGQVPLQEEDDES